MLDIGHEPKAGGSNQNASDEIAEDAAKPEPARDGHKNNRRSEQKHECGEHQGLMRHSRLKDGGPYDVIDM